MKCQRDNCTGTYEASAKVYFDCELDTDDHGELALVELTFSSTNDTFDGHPVALEFELGVHCDECGHEPGWSIPHHGDVMARSVLQGSV